MPIFAVYDTEKRQVGEVELSDTVFAAPVNEAVVHEVVRAQLAARRQGTAQTKERSDISGGGKKPWRQKGTGRARAGSSRSPLWRKGGTTFGPHPRSFALKVSRKVRRQALVSALSAKVRSGKICVINDFVLPEIKTRLFREIMNRFDWGKILLVTDKVRPELELSCRNIQGVKLLRYEGVNVFDLLNCDEVVFLEPSIKKLEEVLTGHGKV
jgi:large subunit ribosomal protein L4